MATNPPIYPQPPKSNLPMALAGGAIVAMLAGNIYLFVQIQDLKKEASKTSDAMQAEIEKLQEDTTAVGATSRKHAEQLREQLDSSTRQTLAAAQAAAQKAKLEAMSSSEQSTRKLEQEQLQTAQKLSTDIGDVKQ